jgi:hypothetical protein
MRYFAQHRSPRRCLPAVVSEPVIDLVRLEAVPPSVRTARTWIASRLGDWSPEGVATVQLLLSEVVTNVVLHGRTPFEVSLRRDGPCALVGVADASPLPPQVKPYPSDATTGRGMVLVAALARAWGVDALPVGKRVWFEVADPEPCGADPAGSGRGPTVVTGAPTGLLGAAAHARAAGSPDAAEDHPAPDLVDAVDPPDATGLVAVVDVTDAVDVADVTDLPAGDAMSPTAHLDTAHLGTAHLDTAHLGTAHLGTAHLDTAHPGTAPVTRAPVDTAVVVRLLAVPVAVHLAAAERRDALMRELGYLDAGSAPTAAGPLRILRDRLLELEAVTADRFGASEADIRRTVGDAAATGTPRVDLVIAVPHDGWRALLRLAGRLDEVDRYCESGDLLTTASPPEVRRYRRWYTREVAAQLAGAPPTAWPGASD